MKKPLTLLSPLMVFITLFFILACSQPVPISKTEINQTSIKIEEDDFETYYPASDVVDSINYICLETNELSLFGQITKMEIFEDLFFINDRSANAVFIFTSKGKFVSKIGYPIDQLINDFTIDRLHRNLIVSLETNHGELHHYNFEGKLLSKKDVNFTFKSLHCINGNLLYFRAFTESLSENTLAESDKNKNLLFQDSLGNMVNAEFPYDNKFATRSTVLFSEHDFYRSGNDTYFAIPHQIQLFKLSGKKIESVTDFDLPTSYTIPQEFLTSKSFALKQIEHITNIKNKDLIWWVKNIYTTGKDILTFDLQKQKYSNNTYIYNRNIGLSVPLSNIYLDASINFLPLTEFKFTASDGIYLYGNFRPTTLLNKIKLPEVAKILKLKGLDQGFSQVSSFSNPIITQIKIKSFKQLNPKKI